MLSEVKFHLSITIFKINYEAHTQLVAKTHQKMINLISFEVSEQLAELNIMNIFAHVRFSLCIEVFFYHYVFF